MFRSQLKHLKHLEYIFAGIALAFGLLFIHIVPPMWGVDEIAHFSRAYQISKGELTEKKLEGGFYGGSLPITVVEATTAATIDLQNNRPHGISWKDVDNKDVYNKIKRASLEEKSIDWNFVSAGSYPPVAYAAPSTGIFIARQIDATVGSVVFGARFATLLAYIVLVGLALRLLRDSKAKWIAFTVALLPMSLFQASIVNVDSLAIGLALLLFAYVLKLWQQKNPLNRQQLALLTALCIAIPLTKPNYFLLTLLVMTLPARMLVSRWRLIYVRAVLPVLAVLPTLAWYYFVRDVLRSAADFQHPGGKAATIDAVQQLQHILASPLAFTGKIIDNSIQLPWYNGMLGLLGFNMVMLPLVIICLLTVLLVIAALYAYTPPEGKKSKTGKVNLLPATMCVLGVTTAVSIIVSFYLTFNPVGSSAPIKGIQGRYFLPMLPFVLYGLTLVPMRVTMSERTARVFFITATLAGLLFALLWYYRFTY